MLVLPLISTWLMILLIKGCISIKFRPVRNYWDNHSHLLCQLYLFTDAGPASFETAISATGFGRYNLLLILVIFPAGWSNSFESSTMSYVFPAAQCDLDLSLEDKGLLNAITYLGTVVSNIFVLSMIEMIVILPTKRSNFDKKKHYNDSEA